MGRKSRLERNLNHTNIRYNGIFYILSLTRKVILLSIERHRLKQDWEKVEVEYEHCTKIWSESVSALLPFFSVI